MPYAERLVTSPLIACTWEQHAPDARVQRVVPDACVDLIWTGAQLQVAGPDTTSRLVALDAGARVVGVRLRPGVAGDVLGMPASVLRDAQPDAADVLGRDVARALEEALLAGGDPHALLLRALTLRGVHEPDPLVAAAVRALGRPRARVAGVARDLGVSERQLHRRVRAAAGYPPKQLARVLRLRLLQLTDPASPLALRALDAGYADQAHMNAEVRALTGLSPVRFLKDRAPTAA